jgi:hypothetical protein
MFTKVLTNAGHVKQWEKHCEPLFFFFVFFLTCVIPCILGYNCYNFPTHAQLFCVCDVS